MSHPTWPHAVNNRFLYYILDLEESAKENLSPSPSSQAYVWEWNFLTFKAISNLKVVLVFLLPHMSRSWWLLLRRQPQSYCSPQKKYVLQVGTPFNLSWRVIWFISFELPLSLFKRSLDRVSCARLYKSAAHHLQWTKPWLESKEF